VTGLRLEADRVLLQDGSGTTHAAQKAVLAWGHFPPAPIRVPDGGLYRSPLYCPSPWTPDALRAVPPDAPVLLLGTGLTAVDALVTLKALGHHGPVEALSRHGLWPEVHAPQAATGTRAAPFQPEPTARAYLGELRRRVRTETQTGGDWRAAVDGLRPWTAQAWQRLPEKEQRRFLRHLRALWEIHRHRTAPEPGNVVSELARAGRLRTHAGRLVDFRLEGTEGGVRARIHPRGQRTVREIEVLRVVNCTGPGPLGPAASPLVAELVHGGWARVDRFGLGLETDVRGALLDAAGRPSERLYTLGPLRRGGLWESTAVPEIRAQAAALAEHLGGPG
ncbi:MAG TPA: hydroxyacylglutathione hydrolase, partial [Myxococcaceae bacterium]|nr:hydroxyacylglutathione hydrolase [Myxococcaceae bacterium]